VESVKLPVGKSVVLNWLGLGPGRAGDLRRLFVGQSGKGRDASRKTNYACNHYCKSDQWVDICTQQTRPMLNCWNWKRSCQ
jgi:hypothetical protein